MIIAGRDLLEAKRDRGRLPESRLSMEAIFYNGRLAAQATAERLILDPELEALEVDDPERRFVEAMGLYAIDVAAGELPGPYSSAEAERYAREILMPGSDFWLAERAAATRPDGSDEHLAKRFGVPLEQIAAKRQDRR